MDVMAFTSLNDGLTDLHTLMNKNDRRAKSFVSSYFCLAVLPSKSIRSRLAFD